MSNINFVSFPGLGIGELRLNKIAFTIFGRNVAWYGIIIMLGIIAGVAYVLYRANHDENISSDIILDLAIFIIVSAVIGARLYYVATSFGDFVGDSIGETLYNCIAIWEGGIAIYGAIIGGGIAAFIFARVRKIDVARLFDTLAPAVMIGQVIGRWGNFMNAEAHGTVTMLPWRMGIRADGSSFTSYVHPTFLYESLWNLIGFILINIFYRKKKFNGQIFLLYITWYGFGRMFIEGLRTDSLYVGPFRISQVVGFVTFVAGIIMLAVFGIRAQSAGKAVSASDADKAEKIGTETDKSKATAKEAETTEAKPDKAETAAKEAEATEAEPDKAETAAKETEEAGTEPDKG